MYLARRLFNNFAVQNKVPNLTKAFTDFATDKEKPATSGRAWRPDELRLKSNEDLHKLWYVCLREKNLLLADKVLEKDAKAGQGGRLVLPNRIHKVSLTMARILTIISERQKARQDYRRQLEEQYISKKREELLQKVRESKVDEVPEVTWRLMKEKYRELRRGVDSIAYLEKEAEHQKNKQQLKYQLDEKFKQPLPEFTSFFEQQLATGNLKPTQEEILRSHIKNWRLLSLKQRRMVLGFLNARRSRDAKTEFLKELKMLGQRIAYQNAQAQVKSA